MGRSDAKDSEAPLITERLWLEPVLPEHAPELYEVLLDPALYRFLPERPPESVEALSARFQRLSPRISPDGREIWLNFALRERASGRCVGYLQATIWGKERADLGYLISPLFAHRGYATEASRALLALLKSRYKVARVEATIDRRNLRSRALAERLGFCQDPERSQDDDLVYVLLLNEPASPPAA